MGLARFAYQWLAWLFLAALGVQFFFAGMGTMGGESIDPHRILGMVMVGVALLNLILALVASLGKKLIAMSVVLLALMGLQTVFSRPGLDPEFLRTFHVFNAFLLVGLVYHIAKSVGLPFTRSA